MYKNWKSLPQDVILKEYLISAKIREVYDKNQKRILNEKEKTI